MSTTQRTLWESVIDEGPIRVVVPPEGPPTETNTQTYREEIEKRMALIDEYKQAIQDVLDGRVPRAPKPSEFPDTDDMRAAMYMGAAAVKKAGDDGAEGRVMFINFTSGGPLFTHRQLGLLAKAGYVLIGKYSDNDVGYVFAPMLQNPSDDTFMCDFHAARVIYGPGGYEGYIKTASFQEYTDDDESYDWLLDEYEWSSAEGAKKVVSMKNGVVVEEKKDGDPDPEPKSEE